VVGEEGAALVAVIDGGTRLARAALTCWDHGRAVLPVDPALTRSEMDVLFDRLRPAFVMADGELFRYPDGQPVAREVVAVVATSGTTGEPKGVELTRAGMVAMGRGYSDGLGAGPDDKWLACLPLHHVASLAVLARAYVTGVPWIVHDDFDVQRVADAPHDEGATIVSVVPTALHRLLESGGPLHEYRCVIVGGAPCPPALRSRAIERKVGIVDAYGMSETWGGWALDGVPIEGAEARVAADGELLVRGPMVMRAYRRDPEETAAVLEPDGWLHTGDVGTFADGIVTVTDRKKDIIITGGVNVSPTEIETVLAEHPRVQDVCVVGLPDEEWGERVVAYVVATAPPSVDDLREFARDRLAPPKLPREVRWIPEIPRSPSGKPLRRVLRDR